MIVETYTREQSDVYVSLLRGEVVVVLLVLVMLLTD